MSGTDERPRLVLSGTWEIIERFTSRSLAPGGPLVAGAGNVRSTGQPARTNIQFTPSVYRITCGTLAEYNVPTVLVTSEQATSGQPPRLNFSTYIPQPMWYDKPLGRSDDMFPDDDRLPELQISVEDMRWTLYYSCLVRQRARAGVPTGTRNNNIVGHLLLRRYAAFVVEKLRSFMSSMPMNVWRIDVTNLSDRPRTIWETSQTQNSTGTRGRFFQSLVAGRQVSLDFDLTYPVQFRWSTTMTIEDASSPPDAILNEIISRVFLEPDAALNPEEEYPQFEQDGE